MTVTKYQTGEVKRVKRSELQVARVNPRVISKHAKKLLKGNLKEVGLLGPAIFYNAELGELLSGHQRLEQLDALERGRDYELDVTVVRMDRAKHDATLVFLNNPNAQGDFEYAQLGELFAHAPELAPMAGFDHADLATMFPDDGRFGNMFEPAKPPEQVERDVTELEKLRARRKEAKAKARERDALDYHVVVVAKDGATLRKLLAACGYGPDERYISAERLITLMEGSE